jgi:hypothetical protein
MDSIKADRSLPHCIEESRGGEVFLDPVLVKII